MKPKYKLLDEVVLDALRFLGDRKPKPLGLLPDRRRLVVGSGNALPTGRVLFRDEDAVFADEGQYRQALQRVPTIDAAAVISASGVKHAPVIVADLLRRRLPTALITCNGKSEAAGLLRKAKGRVIETPSLPEPRTYNTSTYLGMILAKTREAPEAIRRHILRRVSPRVPGGLGRYAAYYLIVPPEFDDLRPMFITKFDELFGPRVCGRCYTLEQTKHAKTVIPSPSELFISFGCGNKWFGLKGRRLEIPLPRKADAAAMIAVAYYVIGRIQRAKPPWFLRNIDRYAAVQDRLFG